MNPQTFRAVEPVFFRFKLLPTFFTDMEAEVAGEMAALALFYDVAESLKDKEE